MLAKVLTGAVVGLDGALVEVEVDSAQRLRPGAPGAGRDLLEWGHQREGERWRR